MKSQYCYVVGVNNLPNGTFYSTLLVAAEGNDKGQFKWSFNRAMLNEEQVKKSFADGVKWINIEIQSGKLVGKTGSLDRFKGAKKPYVIIAEIVDNFGTTLGYKVADCNCTVKNIPARELLAYGNRITVLNKEAKRKNPKAFDIVPVQNAMFVPGDKQGGKKPFYRAYAGGDFIKEVYVRNKNAYADTRKETGKEHAKNLNRLEQIYTAAQIKQLKLGKDKGINFKLYANPQLSANQMRALRLGLENGVDIRRYAFPEYDYTCMLYYNDCLENGINIEQCISPKYSLGQLSELSIAIQSGIDISQMSDPSLSANTMANLRERLEFETWNTIDVSKCGNWEDWVKAGKENVSW